jgi:hypothetical protein
MGRCRDVGPGPPYFMNGLRMLLNLSAICDTKFGSADHPILRSPMLSFLNIYYVHIILWAVIFHLHRRSQGGGGSVGPDPGILDIRKISLFPVF